MDKMNECIPFLYRYLSYERLLELARKMHTWIFLHAADEQKVYDELGITEDENIIFGYSGQLKIKIPQEDKENG